jgi:hypothetical protein
MKKATLIVLAFTVLAAKSNAQVLPVVEQHFNNYTSKTLQEKLFVHINKPAYTAGELLWFKVYNVDANYLLPLDVSKVVYIEVLDDNQSPVLQAKIAMKNGEGSGSLFIPLTFYTGNYTLRAYTSWMKNFSADYYFAQKLTIINPLKSPGIIDKTAGDEYAVQYFPEGGHLVNGLTGVVGFKATSRQGKGVYFKGAILNQKNDTVVKFSPLKYGMGRFTFKPESNFTYHAVVNVNGKVLQQNLPAASNAGYVMSVKDNGTGQLAVNINTTIANQNIYLFAQTHNVIKYVASATASNGIAAFSIDKKKLGDGISQITIFDNDKKPVCERLYFKRPAKTLTINAAVNTPLYTTRKKVDINFDTKGADGAPVAASLSLSVYKLDSLLQKSPVNILNYLWLSADLKGSIEAPDYYFISTDLVADEAADNLMLTQGWRSFDWNDALSEKIPVFKFLPEVNGPIVNAKITNRFNQQPAAEIITYLGITGKSVQLYASKSDSLGRLIFNMHNFYGTAELVAQTNTTIDTNYRIEVLTPFSAQFAAGSSSRFEIDKTLQNTFADQSLAMQVQNIYSGTNLKQFYNPHADSSAFYGAPYKTYLLDNYTRFTTMEEVMREYIREVNIFHVHNQFEIKVLKGAGFLQDGEPMVLIDGIPFFNINKVFTADPLKIRKLESIPFPYYLGPSFEDGIFSLTSYKGDMGGVEIDPHALVLDYEGLQQERKFYSPVYESEQQTASHLPDFRNVLYWSPSVYTTTNGQNSLSIYTSDQQGSYIGIMQGITKNGEAGYHEFRFDVK